jgi:hypothetical protein
MRITLTEREAEAIYEVACGHEGLDVWGQEHGGVIRGYHVQTDQRGWTDGGLERAISEFLTGGGAFAPDMPYADLLESLAVDVEGEQLLSYPEAAAHLGVTYAHVSRLVTEGTLTARYEDGALRIPIGEVVAYQASRRPVGRPRKPAAQ